MTQLPPPPSLAELNRDERLALFLDFDGTLVEIAPLPDAIVVPDSLADSLHRLRDQLDGRLALVSGRGIVDLEKHLGALAIARAGSHGSDCRDAGGAVLGAAARGLPQEVMEEIERAAVREGFDIESKPHGAALHYRKDPALESGVLELATRIADRGALQLKRGKCVVEIVNPGADKASAVETLMQEAPFSGANPVFIGDDVTDEDGMRRARDLGGFGIAVGDRPSENAKYGLASPAAVHHWLGL